MFGGIFESWCERSELLDGSTCCVELSGPSVLEVSSSRGSTSLSTVSLS